ncbi:hypothetical protein BGZ82_010432 [Podila clonocystis]|nr:hypothetical protein BGZ82_010432 [Podila clonocystis]
MKLRASRTITFGLKTTSTSLTAVRVQGTENIQPFLDTFRSYGHTEIDIARIYGNGETEKALGQTHVDKVDICYLHAPDFSTPFEETLKAVDGLYREGLFNKARSRSLVDCSLENISLKTQLSMMEVAMTARYRGRYWNGLFLKAIQDLKTTAESLGFSLVNATFRWMVHHSGLGPNDGIVMGASSVSLLKTNMDILAHVQPLPEEMVMAFDAAWEHVQPACPSYFKTEGVIKTYLPTAPGSSS